MRTSLLFTTTTLSACLLTFTTALNAANFPPQDHQGSDLILQNGDFIWGVHENVGRFEVPTSATVYVAPYDRLIPQAGTGGDAFPPVISTDETPDIIYLDYDGTGSEYDYSAPGAGGGILIKLLENATGTIESGATIASMGGLDINDQISPNGGTIKIFSEGQLTIDESADIRAPRIIKPGEPIPPAPDIIGVAPTGGYIRTTDTLILAARVFNNSTYENGAKGELWYNWESDSGEKMRDKKILFADEYDREFDEKLIYLTEDTEGVSFDPGETWTLTVIPRSPNIYTSGEPQKISFFIESENCATILGDGTAGTLRLNGFVIY